MGLTDDQKAMLRLLAQREEGYEDMAALMGISVEELRARVKEALVEVEEPGEPPTPDPADARPAAAPPSEPEPRRAADPAPAPPSPAADPAPAPPSPAAEPEPSPAGAPQPEAPSAKPAATARPRAKRRLSGLRLPRDRGALIGLGAGALALVVLVAILLLGGDDGESDSPSAGAANGNLTQAVLEPTGGGDASGRALFGRYRKDVLLQVEAQGLEPSPRGQTYTIWLYRSPNLVLRIGAVKVGQAGKIAVQLPVPAQVLAYVASGTFDQVDISLTSTAAYRTELARAKRRQRLPRYTGESVLRGEITGPAIQ